MSSSAPKLAPEAEPAPFRYAEAGVAGAGAGMNAEQAAERQHRQETDAFESGRQAGQQQVEAAVRQQREQTLRALEDFAKERTSYYRRVEAEVVQLALGIARKILHREAQLDAHLLAGIVRVTLDQMDAGTNVELHVPPREAADWRHYFSCQVEGAPMPEVREDAALPAGGCRVETALGTTEVGLEAQLKEIETGLLDLLAERPGSDVPSAAPGGNTKATGQAR